MMRPWRVGWGLTAATGWVSLILGGIDAYTSADYCASGSHYEVFWITWEPCLCGSR
jgi:hypothetical protein